MQHFSVGPQSQSDEHVGALIGHISWLLYGGHVPWWLQPSSASVPINRQKAANITNSLTIAISMLIQGFDLKSIKNCFTAMQKLNI